MKSILKSTNIYLEPAFTLRYNGIKLYSCINKPYIESRENDMTGMKREQKIVLIVLVLVLFAGLSYLSHRKNSHLIENAGFVMENPIENGTIQGSSFPTTDPTSLVEDQKSIIAVHIEGAVVDPGIYYIDEKIIRVNDVLKLAGGFKEEADRKRVNLAKLVKDEEFIYIPMIGEEVDPNIMPIREIEEREISGKININHASLEELMTLTGIGDAYGRRIIQYRETNGFFTSIEEITKVSGIGPVTFENIKDRITVNQ